MLFSWKKVKGISQFFGDHFESHRRQGGPFMVETGFPTSIVDLVMKNSDTFKKPKSSEEKAAKKKKKKNKKNKIKNDNLSVLPSPSPTSSPLYIPRVPCSTPLVVPNPIVSSSSLAVNSDGGGGGSGKIPERPNVKGYLGAILRLSCVVIIALKAENFTVGVIISSLLLLCLEFIGKQSWLKIQRICQIIRFRNINFDDDQKLNTDTTGNDTEIKQEEKQRSNDNCYGGNPICEIEIASAAEPMFVGTQEVPLRLDQDQDQPSVGTGSGGGFCNGNKEEEEEEEEEEEIKPKKGKRAKMKSKIKRLFHKKFKGGKSKKEKGDLESTKKGEEEEEEGLEEEGIVQYQNDHHQSIIMISSRSTSITREGNDEVSTICNSSSSEEMINSDEIITGEEEEQDNDDDEEEEEERKGKHNLEGIVSCIIGVLAIAIWGCKLIAMVWVISWLLILKAREIRKNIHTYTHNTSFNTHIKV